MGKSTNAPPSRATAQPAGFGSALLRDAGIGIRGVLEGAQHLINTPADAATALYNLATSPQARSATLAQIKNPGLGWLQEPSNMPSSIVSEGLGKVLPTARTLPEKALSFGTSVLGGGDTALGRVVELAGGNPAIFNVGRDASAATLSSKSQAASAAQSLNAGRDAVIAAARKAGYVIPPTAAKPNLLNTALESLAGKAATRQTAEATNQEATNALVRGDLGIAPHLPATRAVLKGVRKGAGSIYSRLEGIGPFASDPTYTAAIDKLGASSPDLEKAYPGVGAQASAKVQALVQALKVESHDGKSAIALTKLLRSQGAANFTRAFRTGDPEALELAHAQQGGANALEELIGRHLQSSGQGELAQGWKSARKVIAKSYQAQAALKGNNFSAVKLAQQAEKDKPVTDGMGLAANFAAHFPEVSRIPKSGAGVSKLAATLGLIGEGSGLWFHSPEAMVGSAGLMAAPYATRAALLSKVGQKVLATPRYGPGVSALTSASLVRLLRNPGTYAALQAALPKSLPGPQ